MKVLLRRDVANVGLAGDVVEVKQGYARNYLFPQRLGVEPTALNLKQVEEDKRRAAEERKKVREALQREAKRLEGVEVTISAACNPEGHLYGSVGPREISAALRDEGHAVEAKQVELREPIRQLDSVTVPITFAEDLKVEIKVWVVREGGAGELEEQTSTAAEETDDADAAGSAGDVGG